MGTRRTASAAGAGAVLLWLASPAVGVGWLAWVALVPVAAVIVAEPAASRARWSLPLAYGIYLELLLVPSLPFGIAEGQFGEPPLPIMVAGSPVLFVAFVAVPLFALGLWALGFGRPSGPFAPRAAPAAAALVLMPAAWWTVLDFARVNLDPAGMWGPLYLSQAAIPPAEMSTLAGPWLVTFAIVAVNFAIALALVRRRPAFALAPLAPVAALVLAAPGPAVTGERIELAAVQPGYETPDDEPVLRNFRPGSWGRGALDVIGDLAEMTEEAAEAGAELVVWPEATMYVDPRRRGSIADELGGVARRADTALVVPFFRPWPERESGVVGVRAADGSLTAAAGKQRPMWFLREGALPAGAEPLDVGGVRVGALLGVDTQDPRSAARLAGRGAQVLAAATHDWQELSAHHRAAAKIAARSAGLGLVRSDWQYRSSIVAPDGRTLADAGGERRRVVLRGSLPLAGSTTPYTASGDALPVALLALGAVALAWASGRRLLSGGRDGSSGG